MRHANRRNRKIHPVTCSSQRHTKSSGNPNRLPSRFLTAACHPKGKASFWESLQFALSESYESLPAGGPTDELSRQAVSSYEVAPYQGFALSMSGRMARELVESLLGNWSSPKSLPLPTPQPRGATQCIELFVSFIAQMDQSPNQKIAQD